LVRYWELEPDWWEEQQPGTNKSKSRLSPR
jgi:hypothetical protein